MNDKTPAERAEAADTRRRWITLAEAVAVASVLIAALSLYLGWVERRDTATEREIARLSDVAEKSASRRRVTLYASSADTEGIEFKAQMGCPLQSSEIHFPSTLSVEPKSTVITHRIESDWIAKPMLKLTDGGADAREGRIPILIAAHCTADDGEREETAIYDLLWRTKAGGLLNGRSFILRGLVRRASGGNQRSLDALWRGV